VSIVSINRVNISGNLTRDSELRATPGGTQVLNFGVAVNERRKNQQSGEWEDYANFVDCVMFGNRAQKVQPYLAKGTKVAIDGRLHYSSWERDGQRRSKIEVYVDEIEFLSRGNAQQGGGQSFAASTPAASTPSPTPASAPVQTPPSADVFDQDIPF
jgi:single-strand DNA-binding protein